MTRSESQDLRLLWISNLVLECALLLQLHNDTLF